MDVFQELNKFTYQAEGASWPFFVISSLVFALRCIARTCYTEIPWGWDDVVLTISWALNVVRMTSFQLSLVSTRHIDPTNLPGTFPTPVFWALFTDTWAFLSVTLPKVGVALLLCRIFRPRPWVKVTLLSMSIGLFVYCIAGFIISFVQCSPVPFQWNPWKYPEGKCWPGHVQIYYAEPGAAFSTFLDIAFAIYPGVVISRLNMPRWQKITTIGLMSLGFASFAFGVIKVYNNVGMLGDPSPPDTLSAALHIGLWNSIENDFVMIAACLPSIRPILGTFKRLPSRAMSYGSLKSRWSQTPSERSNSVNSQEQLPTTQSIKVSHSFSLEQEKEDGPSWTEKLELSWSEQLADPSSRV
ncbi:hypothetical protein K461DRAFT_314378 [Myriangium duriaei CBS 260.36]|uniref:Rhodopsin domain-containing protein n=1 Tax=Myriangium duriaei CBS 260.36 TaxID=1168546 RepID=A0A9P4IXD7_9PEZI|nr:hypothetical protein K461DRAFT_314378 [Myriangium duriaei CBS 260.36]